jgi:hypothetical protein
MRKTSSYTVNKKLDTWEERIAIVCTVAKYAGKQGRIAG